MASFPIENWHERLREIARSEINRLIYRLNVPFLDRDEAEQIAIIAAWQAVKRATLAADEVFAFSRITMRRAIIKQLIQIPAAKKRGGSGDNRDGRIMQAERAVHVPVILRSPTTDEEFPNPRLISDPWPSVEDEIAIDQLIARHPAWERRRQENTPTVRLEQQRSSGSRQNEHQKRQRFLSFAKRIQKRRYD